MLSKRCLLGKKVGVGVKPQGLSFHLRQVSGSLGEHKPLLFLARMKQTTAQCCTSDTKRAPCSVLCSSGTLQAGDCFGGGRRGGRGRERMKTRGPVRPSRVPGILFPHEQRVGAQKS